MRSNLFSRAALAAAAMCFAAAVSAQSTVTQQPQAGTADKPAAAKKLPSAKSTTTGKRLDFAPATPAAAAAATQGVHPAANSSTPGSLKKDSNCHHSGESDA